MIRAAKVDSNQKEIIKTFRQLGAYVIHTHQIKNAFDCLVFFNGKIYPCEIKDGKKAPSARKLTEGELKCKNEIELQRCQYHVITNIEDVIKLLNNI